jgi:hypothetical protein
LTGLLWLPAGCTTVNAQNTQAEYRQCLNNLRQLALAAAMWSTDNADVAPPDVLSMRNEIATPEVLVCPADPVRQATRNWASLTTNNLSYEFLQPSATNTGPQQVVFRCPIHGIAALLKGTVQESASGRVPPLAPGRETRANPELEDLKRALQDRNPAVRRAALEKFGRKLAEGSQILLTPRRELLEQYEAAQTAAATLLATALSDEDVQVQMAAAWTLGQCGSAA